MVVALTTLSFAGNRPNKAVPSYSDSAARSTALGFPLEENFRNENESKSGSGAYGNDKDADKRGSIGVSARHLAQRIRKECHQKANKQGIADVFALGEFRRQIPGSPGLDKG